MPTPLGDCHSVPDQLRTNTFDMESALWQCVLGLICMFNGILSDPTVVPLPEGLLQQSIEVTTGY